MCLLSKLPDCFLLAYHLFAAIINDLLPIGCHLKRQYCRHNHKLDFMINNRKMTPAKRIAFAATEFNRKAFIEWAYFNQDILRSHELIAAEGMAELLEGTVGVKVRTLPGTLFSANNELSNMIENQKIDMLILFWEPLVGKDSDNGVTMLHDKAIARNIMVAANLATADFVLSSPFMQKQHSVPVTTQPPAYRRVGPGWNGGDGRRALLKLNTLH